MRVLIVDGREIVRFGLKRILAEVWGWVEVSEATNLNSAIEQLTNDNYDFLFIAADIGDKGELPNLIRFLLKETRVVLLSEDTQLDNEEISFMINAVVKTVVEMEDIDVVELKNILTKIPK